MFSTLFSEGFHVALLSDQSEVELLEVAVGIVTNSYNLTVDGSPIRSRDDLLWVCVEDFLLCNHFLQFRWRIAKAVGVSVFHSYLESACFFVLFVVESSH